MKTAFIIDSTTYLDESYREMDNIYIADLTIHFENGDVIIDPNTEESIQSFYSRMKLESELPTTSQPVPGNYYNYFEDIIKKGYEDVYIFHLSSAISGTYQTALMVAQEYKDKLNIHIFDTKAASVLVRSLIYYVMDCVEKGISYDQIDIGIEYIINHYGVYLMVGQLDNLTKGGRLSNTEAFIGNLLRVRPIIYFNEHGELEMIEKIRSNKRVYRRMIEWIEKLENKYGDRVQFEIVQGDALEDALELKNILEEKFSRKTFNISPLSAVLGTHTGSGAVALAYIVLPAQ